MRDGFAFEILKRCIGGAHNSNRSLNHGFASASRAAGCFNFLETQSDGPSRISRSKEDEMKSTMEYIKARERNFVNSNSLWGRKISVYKL